MAVTPTNNHGYKKQDKGDQDWHVALNETLDLLDTDVILRGDDADKPSAGEAGRVYLATDTNQLLYDNGSSWNVVIEDTTKLPSVSDDGSEVVSDISDINFTSNLSVTDDGDGTVTTDFVPAGSDGEIQFNASGSLSSNSNLYWDSGNNRLGVGTTSPETSISTPGDITLESGSSRLYGYAGDGTRRSLNVINTRGSEYGWQTTQLELNEGRFDFIARDGKAEFRVDPSGTQFNIYNSDSKTFYTRILPDGNGNINLNLPAGAFNVKNQDSNHQLRYGNGSQGATGNNGPEITGYNVPLTIYTTNKNQTVGVFYDDGHFRTPNGGISVNQDAAPSEDLDVSGTSVQDLLKLRESSAPSDPASGETVVWMDSSSGDLKAKINSGGTVKTATLADFSAL